MTEKRLWLLDVLRGAALLNMLAYHALYDWVYVFGHTGGWYDIWSPGCHVWQQYICWSFILLSGYSFTLARRPLKNGLLVAGCAVVLTVVTAGFLPSESIWFGVLHLNAAAVLVVNDLIHPFAPKTSDRKLVQYAKTATVVIGVAASVCAVYASSIISLFSRAYAMAGAGIAPLLCIGFFWRERRTEGHVMGKRNTKVTPWGARTGIVVGTVVSQLPVLGISATLVGVVAASVCIVAVSLLTRRVPKGPVPAETAN